MLLGIALVLFVCELLLRMLPVATGLSYQPSNDASPVVHGMPDHDYIYSAGWNLRLVRHGHLNNFGFPADSDYDPSKPNILVIGDSYIEGLMLHPDERLQSVLQQQLHQQIKVYGLGRAGSSMAQKLGVAQWAIPIFHPQVVVFNLSEGDVAESRTSVAGDFFIQTPDGGCRLDRTSRPPESDLAHLAKESSLYHYLTNNLKIVSVFGYILPHSNAGSASADAIAASNDSAVQCIMQLLPHLVGLPPERVVFIVGTSLDAIYSDQPSPGLDIDSLAASLQTHGYGLVSAEPLFRQDYRTFRLPLSFRPTDDHWNARALRLIAQALAWRLDASPEVAGLKAP
jgi:hypothetical protein